MRFLEKRSKNVKFDEAVDQKLLELARRGNVVLDSWTMPWLIKKGFKIWLEASAQRRAERIAQRDGTTVREALKALRNKEKQTKAIYKRIYRFDLGKDFAPFNLILDTDSLEAEEVFQVLCTVLDNVLFHGNKNM
jgi:cytidylate kinase